ncbi:hypothetical protein ABK040_001101 [Willaertia magna]
MSSHRNPVYEYFHNIQVSDLVPSTRQLVTVKVDTTLQEAVKVLSTNKILAAPVLDSGDKLAGMLSVLDIVQYIVSAAPNSDQLKDIDQVEIAGRCITLHPVKHIMGKSQKDQLVPLKTNNASTFAIDLMAAGLHRVVLESDIASDKLTNTLSQTDIVKRLADHLHMGKLKVVGEKLVEELGIGLVEPITVTTKTIVLDAMKKLAENNVSAVAVVDENGKLVGNMSASDLRGFYLDRLPHFELTTEEFLKKYSPTSLSPFSTKLNNLTLLDVVRKLVHPTVVVDGKEQKLEHSMHRVWVVDDEGKCKSVITLTDIMKVIRDLDYQV